MGLIRTVLGAVVSLVVFVIAVKILAVILALVGFAIKIVWLAVILGFFALVIWLLYRLVSPQDAHGV